MGLLKDNRVIDANEFQPDPEILKKKVTFAYVSKGADVYHCLVTYFLQQHHAFEHMNLVTAADTGGLEFIFELIMQTQFDFAHIIAPSVAPRKDTTARLIAADKDIAVCPVWLYDAGVNSIHLNFYRDIQCMKEFTPKSPADGMEKIFASSFDSIVIKRRVLEMFLQAGEKYTQWSNMIDESFREAPPDLVFFAKAHEFGFDAYVDWGCEVATHHTGVDLNSRTVETFVAHRVLDRELGAEQKREMFQTPEGREELGRRLQRGPDAVPDRPDGAAGTETESGETGEAHESSAA